MAKDISNVRVYHKCAVGFAFQTSSTATATVNKFIKEADVAFAGGIEEFMPSGTDGQRFFAKNGHRVAYQAPEVTVSGYCSRTNLALAMESFAGGQPTASGSDVTITDNKITSLILTGIRPYDHCNNVTSCAMVMCITSNGANYDLDLYKSTSKIASQNNVPVGSAISMSTSTGLTVTGILAASPAGTKNILVKTVKYNWGDNPHSHAWLTFAFDDGYQKHQITGCNTKTIKLASGGREAVRFEWTLAGLEYSYASTALTASVIDNDFICSRDLTMTWDSATLAYSLPTEGSFALEGSWDLTAMPDNAAHPENFKRENVMLNVTADIPETTESAKILENARAGTFNSLDFDFDYGDYGMDVAFDDTIAEPNTLPAISGKAFNPNSITFRGRSDATDTTPNLATISIDWRA